MGIPKPAQKLKRIAKQNYSGESIVLDGRHFYKCGFENCTLIWNGGAYFLEKPKYVGTVSIRTDNTMIADTVDLLKHLGFLNPEFAKSWSR